jgi:hypothetical protein
MSIVNDIINKLKIDTSDDPKTLADYLVQLSASLYTASELETDLEVNFVKAWNDIRNFEKITDKQAEMRAKATTEWRDWQRARNTNKTIIEVIRSIKTKLRNLDTIFKEGQNY